MRMDKPVPEMSTSSSMATADNSETAKDDRLARAIKALRERRQRDAALHKKWRTRDPKKLELSASDPPGFFLNRSRQDEEGGRQLVNTALSTLAGDERVVVHARPERERRRGAGEAPSWIKEAYRAAGAIARDSDSSSESGDSSEDDDGHSFHSVESHLPEERRQSRGKGDGDDGEGCGAPVETDAPSQEELTKTLLISESKDDQVRALVLLRRINERRWQSGGPFSDRHEDGVLVRRLTSFLRRPDAVGTADAVYVLFYVLDLMPPDKLQDIFKVAEVEDAMDAVGWFLRKESWPELMNVVANIKAMKIEGNSVSRNKEIRRRQEVAYSTSLSLLNRQAPLPTQNRDSRVTSSRGPRPRPEDRPFRNGFDRTREPPPRDRRNHEQESRPSGSRFHERHLMSVRDLREQDDEEMYRGSRDRRSSDPEDDQHQSSGATPPPPPSQSGATQPPAPAAQNVNRIQKMLAKDPTVARPKLERGMVLETRNRKNIVLMAGYPMPSRDDVAKHVCAVLNSCEGGRICIGVKPETGVIEGRQFTMRERDLFRQGMDQLLGGRFIQPRVLTDFLHVEFRELVPAPYYIVDVRVGKTPPPVNRFKIMEGTHRGKVFVRYQKRTLELTHDLQRRITIEEQAGATDREGGQDKVV